MSWRNFGVFIALVLSFVAGYYLRKPKTIELEVPGPVRLVPEIVYQDTGSVKVIEIPPGPIDSAAVVTAYYTKRPFFFEDTTQEVALRFDGILFENRLIEPQLTLHNLRRPKVVNPWVIWGDGVISTQRLELGLSAEKGPNRFGLGYDLAQGAVSLKYSRKIISF